MNNLMTAHLWAQQTKSHGKGHNLFFEGPTIYSYGHHFPIANFMPAAPGHGRRVVLLTTKTYSNSTAKHIAYVRSAIRHDTTVFHVVDVLANNKANHTANFLSMKESIKSQLNCLAKCRTDSTKARVSEVIVQAATHANAYSQHFRLGRRITLPPGQSVEELTALGQAWDAKDAAAKRQRQKAQEKRGAEALARWMLGATKDVSSVSHLPDAYLRVTTSPLGLPIIETTRGAEFPVDHAKRAYPVLKRCVANMGRIPPDVTIRLGEFKVDQIGQNATIIAGCHCIQWAEIQRIARQLGLEDSNTNQAG